MRKVLVTVIFMVCSSSTIAETLQDFGIQVEENLRRNASQLFGIKQPLLQVVDTPINRSAAKRPEDIVMLADGLKAEFLTRSAADYADMFAFWPDDAQPTHLIFCIEGGRKEISTGKWNPSIQRIDIRTGAVETIVRGMQHCDGITRTPWGTILATEETADGQAYELLDPLTKSDIAILDRQTGRVTDPDALAKRDALPTIAWEGLMVLESGVVIAGDEWRPGTTTSGANGGAIYKFLPAKPNTARKIQMLKDSPLIAGEVYALRVDCQAPSHRNFPQYGQGCEVGNAVWLRVAARAARADANTIKATGYYRPEDLHRDPLYREEGMRFCWANTGNKRAGNYGEVMCAIDVAPQLAGAKQASVMVQRFIDGDQHFNSVDNLAFQPITGILYVLEDDQHGEIYACLPDGQDRDLKSDGCIRILTVLDPSAEPTGFAFSADGRSAYLSIQHSRDQGMPLVDDYPTDDILRITGFEIPEHFSATK